MLCIETRDSHFWPLKASHLFLHVLLDGQHEVLRVEVHAFLGALDAVDADGQVFGHFSVVDAVHASGLQGLAVLGQVGVVVQLGAVSQAAGPGVDAGHRVGGRLLALLVHAVMASDSAVGRLRLDRLAVRTDKH